MNVDGNQFSIDHIICVLRFTTSQPSERCVAFIIFSREDINRFFSEYRFKRHDFRRENVSKCRFLSSSDYSSNFLLQNFILSPNETTKSKQKKRAAAIIIKLNIHKAYFCVQQTNVWSKYSIGSCGQASAVPYSTHVPVFVQHVKVNILKSNHLFLKSVLGTCSQKQREKILPK